MPLYTFKCQECDHVQDAMRSLSERENSPFCEECGSKTRQIIVPVQIAPVLGGGDFPGYKCPITDEFVTSRRQRRNIIAEHNLIEKG